jgi:hypothetical protein
MFDVFYSGTRPNLFAHEQAVESVEQAQQLSRTRFFWFVNYLSDYTGFDFLWEPVPWQADQRHAWFDQYQIDAGVYLVPKDGYTDTNYHADHVIHRLPNIDFWHIPKWIDTASVNYTWAPNPTDPPYIYEFPVEWDWDRAGGPEYRIPGATERKYMDVFVTRTQSDRQDWQVHDNVDCNDPVFRWHPNPFDPPMIYVFGNQHWPAEIRASVEYHVSGATVKKYMHNIRTVRLPGKDQFTCLYPCNFDWSWEPDPGSPPYIYVFGNQWWPAEKMATVEYHVPGATERKYMDLPARLLPANINWHVPDNVDPVSVDFSWVPDPDDPPYIYEFATQWQSNGGAVYTVPGAVERKYVDIPHRRLSNTVNWQVPDTVDSASVDYSWHPSNTEQPFVYEFATQWQPNGGAVYTVPGATERKYVDIQHCRLPNKSAFRLLEYIGKFDYSWHPDNTEPPYNYVFGNQHWPGTDMPTVVYEMPGTTQEKFVDGVVAWLGACMGNWRMFEDIDDSEWDWSWQPNPKDPPYIYAFGNQWNPPEHKVSIQYEVEGATEIKHMELRTRRLPQPQMFGHNLSVSEFDYSWEPNPFDPPMTYVFGNQWNSAVLEPTVIYSTGGTEIKYMDELVATLAQDVSAWELLDDIESFDYSWRPNPTDPPYIYVFGNQWLTPEQRPALQYRVAGATERKFMTHPQAQRRGDATRFVQHYPAEFDWSWEPDPGAPPYHYVFGNQYYSAEIMPTVEYRMPGATERKYTDLPALLLPNPSKNWHMIIQSDWDYTWRPEPGSPAYIYVFGNQWWSAEKMPTVEYHMPGAVERKYMSAPEAKLPVDMTHWHVPANVDTRDMDFSWVPDPGEPPYVYQFATQHQKTGGPQYRVPGATEFKYVDLMRVEVVRESVPVVEIDHLDGAAGQIANTFKRIRYFDNYRDTLIRLAKSLLGQHEYVWVCSSICDYSNFDFSWHPERWQSTMLHVFASDNQKFGDTFYMHVPTFAERAEKKQLLEWYSVNYVPRRKVPRRPMPVIQHSNDSQVDAVKTAEWAGPLATFTNHDCITGNLVTVPLWREQTKTIVPLNPGASSVVVPKTAIPYIKTQLYDYPYVDKTCHMLADQRLDIVFIQNGEPNAAQNLKRLSLLCGAKENRLVTVNNINGRAAAYHAAARASTTPWFFAVFAKLAVDIDFDFSWQPDRMQQAKHYIFHALNPVNGLEYGHQAIIAYNRQLVLDNPGVGLDFTLDSPHEVVPILSGTAYYTTSAWSAWRTAFREALKLRASLPDIENEYRLSKWLDVNGDEADPQWSRLGAEDAVEYYDQVNGDFEQLKKSYEWDWLASYAFFKRNLTPNQ